MAWECPKCAEILTAGSIWSRDHYTGAIELHCPDPACEWRGYADVEACEPQEQDAAYRWRFTSATRDHKEPYS